ncbi:MAG: 3,4-dehydroadipyl-CoA semialdehyde dehydrogenase [Ketobacter sp.]|nr:MAG: 3,4-dehydroadipyl-CoA semialdehyde dehydrogenase [Ketobacter sp.]
MTIRLNAQKSAVNQYSQQAGWFFTRRAANDYNQLHIKVSTVKLLNYLAGQWVEGEGLGVSLCDPVSAEPVAFASSEGLDLAAALDFARVRANPALQALTFAQRADLLAQLADVLMVNRDSYYQAALSNSGNTAVDAGIDVDGGIGTLKYFSALGKSLGESCFAVEAGMDRLSKEKTFQSAHVLTPLKGVAIHINAFNFPSWGLWEKASVSLLAGVPVFAKPATTSSLLTYLMIKDVVDADILPPGSLSLICGGGHDLMDHVQSSDLVFFTGSADTAIKLRSNANVIRSNVRFSVEADSLNMSLLGADVLAGTPLFDAFIKEVVKEMTTKAGQKCTAIRRIMVPASQIDAVAEALSARLAKVVVGDPRNEGVRMGPLMNKSQQQAAEEGLTVLLQETELVFGGGKDFSPVAEDPAAGCFMQPTLLRCDEPLQAQRIHDTEVFGPVSTLMAYQSESEAWALAQRGGGSLACSVFTADDVLALRAVEMLAVHHGRVLLVNETVQAGHTGHGIVMPQCVHGGPGRAGGGEELGGMRGLKHYMQRTAIQGDVAVLKQLLDAAAII